MDQLEIMGLDASYNPSIPILNKVDMKVKKGEVISIIGPSGSGKSTLLRVLMGLLPPTSGKVSLNGKLVNYKNKKDVKDLRDRFAIVFQQFNLFQNMSAMRNVSIAPIKIKRRNRKEVEKEAVDLLTKV